MKKSYVFIPAVLLLVLFVAARGHAGEIDDLLANAKNQGRPVMLEIGAPWCIPCQQMEPVLKKIGEEYKDRLTIIEVDVDKNNEIPSKFHARGIPVQVYLDRNGKEFGRTFGFTPYEEAKAVLKKIGL